MTETFVESGGKVIPIRARYYPLPAGDRGIAMTTALMNRDANGPEGAQHPGIRAFALSAINDVPDRDDYAQAAAIFQAVKKQIKFRGEYSETVQTPWLTLQLQAGDCDDHTTLLLALLRSVGIPARIQTVALHSDEQFEHVFAMAGLRGANGQVARWLALDTSVPFSRPGWQVPRATRRRVWGRALGDPGDRVLAVIKAVQAGANQYYGRVPQQAPDNSSSYPQNSDPQGYAGDGQNYANNIPNDAGKQLQNISGKTLAIGGAGLALATLLLRKR